MPKSKSKTDNVTALNKPWYEIKAAGKDTAEVLIYGDIGASWWGDESITAKSMVNDLDELDADYLDVRINSYGGVVADGIAIFNALRRHKAAVTTHVDGVAYSIASLILMAGDEIHMADNALLMLHAPWGVTVGNAQEMRKQADTLDKYADAMASAYIRDGGPGEDQISDWLKDGEDHYFTAMEAQDLGLVDSTVESIDIAAALRDFDLQRFLQPAAPAAAIPTEESNMTTKVEKTQAADNTPVENNVTDIETKAREKQASEIKARNDALQVRAAPFMGDKEISDLYMAYLQDPSKTVDEFSQEAMALLGDRAEPTTKPGRAVEITADVQDKFKAGAVSALAARAGLGERDDASNQYRGYSLTELARASLSAKNIKTDGMTKMDMVSAAFTHSTSDFGNLLANVAEKAMLKGYDEAEETFQAWTAKGDLPDFKPGSRVDLNSFPSLAQVNEGAEYTYATVGDRGETIQLATYGKLFSITRQAIINDDLGAFTRIPARMGRAAIRTVGDLVYAILTSNPTMSDGTVLFHADHSNLLTGAAIATASVDAMRVAMGTQTVDNETALNIRLAQLLVPMALEGTAKVVRDSQYEVGASTRNNTTPNSVAGTFEVISDARLDAASATVWYGAANSTMHDTIEVAYLDGNETPYLEQQNGWNVDGAEFKVRIDAGVKALDFRTLAKNPGA